MLTVHVFKKDTDRKCFPNLDYTVQRYLNQVETHYSANFRTVKLPLKIKVNGVAKMQPS